MTGFNPATAHYTHRGCNTGRPHDVYTQPRQDRRKLGCLCSKRCDPFPKSVLLNLAIGSVLSHLPPSWCRACRQLQEAHRSNSSGAKLKRWASEARVRVRRKLQLPLTKSARMVCRASVLISSLLFTIPCGSPELKTA
jgi:hypothetical protein